MSSSGNSSLDSDDSPVMRVILLDNYHSSKRARINVVIVIPRTYFVESKRVARARGTLIERDPRCIRAMLLKRSVAIDGVRRVLCRRDPHFFLAACAPRHRATSFYRRRKPKL